MPMKRTSRRSFLKSTAAVGAAALVGTNLAYAPRARAIGANDDAGLESHAITERAFGRKHDSRHQPTVIPDASILAHEHLGLQMHAFTNERTRFDDTKRPNCGGRGDPGTVSNACGRMNPGRGFRPERLFDARTHQSERNRRIVDQ